jgi:hypothetical protein
MLELKPLSAEAIPRALEKAERYRLLNEPGEAESICLDILTIDSENQQALVILLLARTDQFEEWGGDVAQALEVIPRLRGEYERAYYAGIICERHAKAQLKRGGPGSASMAWSGFRDAMQLYTEAEALRPPGNDDARLRWNTCVRILERHPDVQPRVDEPYEAPLE